MATMTACHRQINIDIKGHLIDNAASMIYLITENGTVDTLASAPIANDDSFHLRCKIAQPTAAFLCDDNGNAITMLLTEDAPLQLYPTDKGGYMVEGGPINDKYNITMHQLSDLTEQIINIDHHSETAEEEYESLIAKYHAALSSAITYNLDNIIGVELFIHQESLGMEAEDMRVRFAQFSPQMQSLPQMLQFKSYIEIMERCQVGEPFVDAELQTITGEQLRLSDICGKRKWVLLNFWATWSIPCLHDLPLLREIYARYALMGFEICSISLDPDIEHLREVVAKEQLLWKNVINLNFEDETSISDLYGILAIPSYILIAPDGKIAARDLKADNLLHELQHYIEGADFCTFPQLHDNHIVDENREKIIKKYLQKYLHSKKKHSIFALAIRQMAP